MALNDAAREDDALKVEDRQPVVLELVGSVDGHHVLTRSDELPKERDAERWHDPQMLRACCPGWSNRGVSGERAQRSEVRCTPRAEDSRRFAPLAADARLGPDGAFGPDRA